VFSSGAPFPWLQSFYLRLAALSHHALSQARPLPSQVQFSERIAIRRLRQNDQADQSTVKRIVTVKWDSRGEQAILLVPIRLAGDIRYWVSCDPSASVVRFIEDATVDLTY
jgi:hypothetical protein